MRLNKEKLSLYLDKISEWSVCVIIFVLPFSKSLIEIMIVTGALALLMKKVLLKEPFMKGSAPELFLGVFLAASLVSIYNTQFPELSIKALFSKTLKNAVLFVLVSEAMNTKEKLHNFFIVSILSCMLILIDAAVQYHVTHYDFLHNYPSFSYQTEHDIIRPGYLGFPTASFPYPSDFAAWILVFIFPVMAFMSWGKIKNRIRIMLAFISAALIYFLVLTKTRGAWIGFALSVILIAPFLRAGNFKKLFLVLLILAAVSPFAFRKTVAPYVTSSAGILERNVMWRNGIKLFERHPIIGNGINTFHSSYAQIREDEYKNKKGSYAHNCYIQMAAETGLFGLLSFLCFIGAMIIKGISAARSMQDPFYYSAIAGISLSIIAFLAHSFFDTNLYSLNLAAIFWLSAGLLTALVKLSCKERYETDTCH